MFVPVHGYVGRLRLWTPTLIEAWTCVALIAIGIAFGLAGAPPSWPAVVGQRHRQGRSSRGRYRPLWPVSATRSTPDYCCRSWPTAAVKGTVWGVAGAALLLVGVVVKARLEERFLRSELGPAYDDYARRVPMLVPFAPA
ncbi:methyltransferase family protein [Mesorhizobium atlanticum]